MQDLIIKWLYLHYDAKVFGKVYGGIPRAALINVTLFSLAVLLTPWFWIPFTICILLTFPLVKNKFINWGSLFVVLFIAISSFFGQHSWWEGLPFIYGAVGLILDNSLFIMPLKYDDIEDWEQKRQYLRNPNLTTSNDNTIPLPDERNRILEELNERHQDKYYNTNKSNVNAWRYIIPWGVLIITGFLYYFFVGEPNPLFDSGRYF